MNVELIRCDWGYYKAITNAFVTAGRFRSDVLLDPLSPKGMLRKWVHRIN